MGLKILPVRKRSTEATKKCITQCVAAIPDKKQTEVAKRSELMYPQEYFLMPPEKISSASKKN